MPHLQDINTNKIRGLIAFLGSKSLQNAYIASFNRPELQDSNYHQLIYELNLQSNIDQAVEKINFWKSMGITIVSLGEEHYPQKLKNIFNPPILLFLRGEEDNLKKLKFSLGVVGSRKADSFGCELSLEYSEYAAERGICIVSGLAFGVDTYAHRGALRSSSQFPTIAVLGNGLESIYPSANRQLAQDIVERGGLVISQFRPEERPFAQNFLNRNRIIAGLSDATLVIQAPEKSGSLVTARYALEEGRDILVIPGAVNDPRYTGSNKLIKSGAHIVCRQIDILDFYSSLPIETLADKLSLEIHGLSHDQKIVISRLKKDVKVHIDQLENSFSDRSNLSAALLELELEGIIRQEPGNFIRLVKR